MPGVEEFFAIFLLMVPMQDILIPVKRPDEDFFQDYYGSNEEWDVVRRNDVQDGDIVKWMELVELVDTSDLSSYDDYYQVAHRLDLDNYIDYLLVNIYAATHDWPYNNLGRSERANFW